MITTKTISPRNIWCAFLLIPSLGVAQVDETKQHQAISKPVTLEHKLDSGVFFSCEDGQCGHAQRDVRTNISQTERKRSHSEARRNIDYQRAHINTIKETTARALKKSEELVKRGSSNKPMRVTIYLNELPYDFTKLRGLRKKEQQVEFHEAITSRRAQLKPSQDRVASRVMRMGGKIIKRRFLSNNITAEIPAKSLELLLTEEHVLGIEIDGRLKNDADGIERRRAMGIGDGGNPGVNAGQGSTRSGGNEVVFGVIEAANPLNTTHLSFLDWAGGPSNIIDTDDCSSGNCVGTSTTTGNSHGTNVTSTLMGSIEQGQISTINNINDRRRRSGIAVESKVRYYNAGGFVSGSADAIDGAVAEGVDIINMSLSPTGDYCSNHALNGFQAAARAANDAGVLVVVSAGNDADDLPAGTCSVSSFGAVPETLTVGATNDVSNLGSMNVVGLAAYSGRGSTGVTLNGGRNVQTRLVDLIVTGDVDLIAGSGTTGTTSNIGTSFSAPQVAGTAGLLKDWIHDRGSFGGMDNDPYAWRTLLSVMGDGVSSSFGGGSGFGFTVSDHSGFGHLRFINLDNEIGAGGGWGLQRRYVSQGQIIDWSVGNSNPESPAVQGWKFAALWDWNSHGGSPDIKFQLVDKCPAGGGEQIIRTAARHPLKARMRLRGSEMAVNFHGRCLWMRATIEHASSPFLMYTADYFYTNPRINHDMP